MFGILILAAAGASSLPGYALGQPMEDARTVVPSGKSADAWHLRCAGDSAAPSGLTLTPAEKSAGVQRCWTTEVVDGVEIRAGNPADGDRRSVQEIEFLDGRVVRITRIEDGRTSVWARPEAARIDRLGS